MEPSVSVIIPVYNAENTIQKCLDSVCNQSLKDIEIIIVNDGSTDFTSQILDEYKNKDSRIRVFNINNSGQGIARNVGIDNAEGKYIGFVDADDFIHPDMYNELVELIIESEAQIAQCNINRIASDGTVIESNIINIRNEVVEVTKTSNYFKYYVKNRRHSYECCNKLFKKDFIINNKIYFYDNSLVFAEDLLFNLDTILYIKRGVFLNKGFYNYVYNPCSHSQSIQLDRLEKIWTLFDIFIGKVIKEASVQLLCEVSKFAIIHTMIYATQLLYEEGGKDKVKQLFRREDIRKRLKCGIKSADNQEERIIMFVLKYFPDFIRYKVMKLYCRYMF